MLTCGTDCRKTMVLSVFSDIVDCGEQRKRIMKAIDIAYSYDFGGERQT